VAGEKVWWMAREPKDGLLRVGDLFLTRLRNLNQPTDCPQLNVAGRKIARLFLEKKMI